MKGEHHDSAGAAIWRHGSGPLHRACEWLHADRRRAVRRYNARARQAALAVHRNRLPAATTGFRSLMPPTALFWLVALLLVAATVTALVWPLLRARSPRAVESEDAATTNVYRDQKRQLDAELAAGAITREERDAGLAELAQRLGAELDVKAAPASPSSTRPSYIAALVLAAALPVTALALYAAFGNPGLLRSAASPDARTPMSHEQIDAMVDSLAKRMKERPEDPTGWRLLARAYSAMGRYQDSVTAFAEAARRGPEDAALLADWADALAMQQKSLQGEPSRLIARALTLDPNHPKSLSLAASVAFDRKDYDTAIAEWRKLQAQFAPGSDEAREVTAMIAEADAAKRGAPPPTTTANAAPAGGAAQAGGGASAGVTMSPERTSPSTGATVPQSGASAISGSVSLDPKLRERAAASDTLFIYARAASGPRMPLAIVRATAGELPRPFKLDDSMAMSPAARLSGASEVIVEARISKSGNATPSPGDLLGRSSAIKPGANGVTVVIDDVVR
jgi:cytochrome c-type biogenesis protein CcmH